MLEKNYESPISSLLPMIRPRGALARAIKASSDHGDTITIKAFLGDASIIKKLVGDDADRVLSQLKVALDDLPKQQRSPDRDLARSLLERVMSKIEKKWMPSAYWLGHRDIVEEIKSRVEAACPEMNVDDKNIFFSLLKYPSIDADERQALINAVPGRIREIFQQVVAALKSSASNVEFFETFVLVAQKEAWRSMTKGMLIARNQEIFVRLKSPQAFALAASVVHGNIIAWLESYCTPVPGTDAYVAPHIDGKLVKDAHDKLASYLVEGPLPMLARELATLLDMEEDMLVLAAAMIEGIDSPYFKNSYITREIPKDDGRTLLPNGMIQFSSRNSIFHVQNDALQLHSLLRKDFTDRKPLLEELLEAKKLVMRGIDQEFPPSRRHWEKGYTMERMIRAIEYAPHLFADRIQREPELAPSP